MTFNLRTALEPVWRGDAYWARREPTTGERLDAEHERAICGSVDPDGRLRDMRSDEEARRWAAERADVLAWLPRGASVYDLGCGDGKLKHVRPDLDVYGWDPDPEAAAVARARGTKERATMPPVRALWCCHVVEHMSDPWEYLGAAIAMLPPDALVIVETPDFGSPVALEWGDRFRLLHDPTHVSLFTGESLVRMLRAMDVEILEVAFPGYFGTPLEERRGELHRRPASQGVSPPAPGNVVAVKGRKR